jgi:flagellar hook-length control protein FliK
MAQMVDKAAQSEMRIGLNTSAFGNVEVRTVVHANEVGVMIGSEKGDLRSLLSNELPGIANSLQQQNLRLNQVNFHQQGFAFSNQTSSGSDSQRRFFASKPANTTAPPAEMTSAESSEPADRSSAAGARGLSILA